jgi:DNA-binding response OmpR family regulator
MSPELKPRVFVVDAETVIASTLELILMSRGFNVHSFADPLAALNAAQSVSPDLLVTDVVMPQMSGIELPFRIRQKRPSCKILLFSGQVSFVDLLAEAQEHGHEFFVVRKPVHPAVLIERINEVLQGTGRLMQPHLPSKSLAVA